MTADRGKTGPGKQFGDRETRYDYRGKRGRGMESSGQVIPVGGSAGERLLRDLGPIFRELLEWARSRQGLQDEEAG
jgi:hypothetical protein